MSLKSSAEKWRPIPPWCGFLTKTTCAGWVKAKHSLYRFALRSGKCAADFHQLFFFFLPLFVFFASVIQLFCSWDRTLFFPLLLLVLWIHWGRLVGLPTSLLVLIQLWSPVCQSKIFLVHLSSGRVKILFAILHLSLLCISIQHGNFIFFM